jgi:catechol 2,3-dioxygenase-like lactoylglutathione lyase family enzyme
LATTRFGGFDHVDCRVRSLASVESFYDALMPEIGLPLKRFAHVDVAGEWHDASHERPYNAVEYYEAPHGNATAFFIGFIERAGHEPGDTRIAFRVEPVRLEELEELLERIGAQSVEPSEDMAAYPAIFFEDPVGTKLEIVVRSSS